MADRIQCESEAAQIARLLRVRESFDHLAVRAADLIDRQHKELGRLRENTIEECAKAAFSFAEYPQNQFMDHSAILTAKMIAEEIRALTPKGTT